MKKIKILTSIICVIILFLGACKKEDNKPTPTTYKGKQITSFSIVTPSATGIIDTINKVITINVPQGTTLTSLNTNIALPNGISITPASGQTQNFTNPVLYTVKLPDNSTSVWTVKVLTTGIVVTTVNVTQDITTSLTWTADKLYVVNGSIEIGNNAVLTIEPGTVIKFNAGASLSVGYSTNGTLIANGTVDKPITFTSSAALPTAGAWDGLYFYSKTQSSSLLKYCNIQFAGSNSGYGAVNILACDLAMDYCTIGNSGSDAIYTTYTDPKGGFVTFTNNTITNAVKYGIEINAQKVSSIGTANTITGTKGVFIFGDFRSTVAQTWKNLGVPYIIASEVDIDGDLTLEAGTTFKFEAAGWLAFGYYASTSINLVGTAASPITFTSNAANPTAGAWRGLTFYGKTLSTSNMSYCIVDYAGSLTSYGAVDLVGCSISYTYNIIRNCNSFGIILNSTAGFKSFSNNSISSTDHLISMSTLHIPDLGTSNVYTAATGKGIQISGDANYANAVTWKKQSADFYIDEEIDLDGTITVEAGTTFKFDANGWFAIGYYANTTFIATGTSTNNIKFTSSAALPVAGAWKEIRFYNKTLSNTTLSYCILEYCGAGSVPSIQADASMSVNNSQINNSSSTTKAATTGTAVVTASGNNFTFVKI
jgi:hypothetical protein